MILLTTVLVLVGLLVEDTIFAWYEAKERWRKEE